MDSHHKHFESLHEETKAELSKTVARVEVLETRADTGLLSGFVEEFNKMKATVETLSKAQTGISDELRTELNTLGKMVRSSSVIVHSAPYMGTPEQDAQAILSQIGDLASFGEIKAYR